MKRILLSLTIVLIGGIISFINASPSEATKLTNTEVICDNKDSCFSNYLTGGEWGYVEPGTGDSSTAYNDHAYWTYNSQGSSLDWGKWQPNLPEDGTYEVFIWYPHYPGNVPETNNAHYQLHHADGDFNFTHDQANSYGTWNKIASVRCRAGNECYLKLTDETSESAGTRRVWFDAVKFVWTAPFDPTPEPVHNYTEIWGAEENGKTTIFLKVCGRGERHRFRSVQLPDNDILWDETYGALDNNCSRDYRAVIDALPGDKFRFYSAVMNDPLSDDEFVQQRRDSCIVLSKGKVGCTKGDTVPPIAEPVTPPPPSQNPCDMPFFWQVDPAWKNHPLRTLGACSYACRTIGSCGCTLTSAAMVFKYHGANLNPRSLSDCTWNYACPFYWNIGKDCSNRNGGSTSSYNHYGFSWGELSRQVNSPNKSVILGMAKSWTHWIVVTQGSGSSPYNYTINDPAYKGGAGMNLGYYYNKGWSFTNIAVYEGQGGCSAISQATDPTPKQDKPKKPTITDPAGGSTSQGRVSSTDTISGSVLVYRATPVTMTLELTNTVGTDADMLIWTDTISSTTWQPFSPYVAVPISDWVYARFRDQEGNSTEPIQAPSHIAMLSSPADPVSEVLVQNLLLDGSSSTSVGTSRTFTVTVEPTIATTPITYTWQATDHQAESHTSNTTDTKTLRWDTPGTKLITVTASNGYGSQVNATHTIAVVEGKISLSALHLTGKSIGAVGTSLSFTANIEPATATTPITYTWQATDQDTTSNTGTLSNTITYIWNTSGTKNITATASNGYGEPITTAHSVSISESAVENSVLYLPVIHR